MARRKKAGINTNRNNWNYVFSEETKSALAEVLEFDETLVPGTACPNLELILYAAGAFKQYVTPELQARDVIVCTAGHLNAIPTAEFTLEIILSSLKNVYTYHVDFLRRGRGAWQKDRRSLATRSASLSLPKRVTLSTAWRTAS
jgi:phosphoglycerate dehydrogenase-like enzyme